jgi:hypothetical protein
MSELLRTEEFRNRVVAYIRANLRAYLPGLESLATIKNIPREKNLAYNRPPNPDSLTYEDLQELELRLARAEQLHTCQVWRCLGFNKEGEYVCKRRAPFECAPEEFVTEEGRWGQKRLYGYMNGWVPGVLVNVRCNNDGKLLTNSRDTKNITSYVTSYTAKNQSKTHNLSAIIADGFAFHEAHAKPEYVESIRNNQRLLLFRLVHAINREQELAAPMVMSYLMGWGDTFKSHTYSPIYWSSFLKELEKVFPDLVQSRW